MKLKTSNVHLYNPWIGHVGKMTGWKKSQSNATKQIISPLLNNMSVSPILVLGITRSL